MRATTLLNRVFDLPGVRVTGVDLDEVDGTGPVVGLPGMFVHDRSPVRPA